MKDAEYLLTPLGDEGLRVLREDKSYTAIFFYTNSTMSFLQI